MSNFAWVICTKLSEQDMNEANTIYSAWPRGHAVPLFQQLTWPLFSDRSKPVINHSDADKSQGKRLASFVLVEKKKIAVIWLAEQTKALENEIYRKTYIKKLKRATKTPPPPLMN